MPENPLANETHEMTVIGALLNVDGKHRLILDVLEPEDFDFRQHRQAFEVLAVMYEGGHTHPEPEEAQAVAERLGHAKLNRRYWMNRYLEYRDAPGREIAAVRRLKDCRARRRLLAYASDIASAARDPLNFDVETSAEMSYETWRSSVVVPDTLGAEHTDWHSDDCIGREPAWLIPHMMERQMRATLIGDSGLGKTWIGRQIALCVSQGVHPFAPTIAFPKRKVLMVELENDLSTVSESLAVIRRQLGHWLSHHGIEQDLSTLVHRAPDRPLRLDVPAEYRQLERLVGRVQPDLLVVGPLYRMLLHEDRNMEGEATRFQERIDNLRRISGAAVIIEAHSAKGIRGSVRGSAAWENWPEYGWELRDKSPRDEPRTHAWVGMTRGPRGRGRMPAALQKEAQLLGSSKLPWYPVSRVSADA